MKTGIPFTTTGNKKITSEKSLRRDHIIFLRVKHNKLDNIKPNKFSNFIGLYHKAREGVRYE